MKHVGDVNMSCDCSGSHDGDNAGMDFPARLRFFREQLKLSQEALGNACGHSQSWIANFEAGRQRPRFDDIPVLADRLRIHPGELFSDLPAASQGVRHNDETMDAAVELLSLMADARPDDPRFARPTWTMIKVAAKILSEGAGSKGKAMQAVMQEIQQGG